MKLIVKDLERLSKITLLKGLNLKVDLEEKIFKNNKEKEKKREVNVTNGREK